ncbi:5-oxoprolinase/urea amidolyase family protein [Bryobacter aggregatus]|uniref:5-oxoprolinase/urea amidolyase family protein n=1 Tax=Bryobacter aggregatus TaxID=360054 RepID=UPI0004E0CB35|nr:5-oxoprolinase/urea amidolyase family protein [Bryobacter aggregatus]
MFRKVLIANRGAIACRIERTLKRMGIASVAVYSEADRHAQHVEDADEAVLLGPAPAAESYLRGDRIIEIARELGVQAIHPGYGFLSENASFAESCEAAGIKFIGPTAEQMRAFGLKHRARELAVQAQVPLLPGTGLLSGTDEAKREAGRIGYPVMLKSTAGGGGIGMRLCRNEAELVDSYASVERLSLANFKDAGLYLEKYVEKARHIEVQIFGDGRGSAIALGERDCSVQRRNQKIIEETPAPGLSEASRKDLLAVAERLAATVGYESAGTVEFVYDEAAKQFYFLEVNTRLQVEHGVTEEVSGVDLVEWMLLAAAGEIGDLEARRPQPQGASIQVRLYAEDPNKNFQPSAGRLTNVALPTNLARVDGWVRSGSEVTAYYDPLLAKLIVKADTREAALAKLGAALAAARLDGIETNLTYLRALIEDPRFVSGEVFTKMTDSFVYKPRSFEVLDGGTMTTVQDLPGRLGYWDVGVPPSGPMDALSFRTGNLLLGNPEGAAGFECTLNGPTLHFHCDTRIVLSGAQMEATLNGKPVPYWQAIEVPAGATLEVTAVEGPGARTYILFEGGLDLPDYLGSKSTFTLGNFGGHGGRALRTGDVLHLGAQTEQGTAEVLPIPEITNTWNIEVLYGPHGAPDFFTDQDIETFFATSWKVHYNSSRTGVRLIGPKPEWARKDGGEAGLHPSNIHDNAYAIGTVDFTGDMPVILGPDGPSLGGFVCPATITSRDLWKIGQLKAGDTIRFHAVAMDGVRAPAIVHTNKDVVYRQSGDRYLLIEYGEKILDLPLRFRVQAVYNWFLANKPAGVIDVTPGIRSFQVHYDPTRVSRQTLLDLIDRAEADGDSDANAEVPSREVWLPLSWDDPATRLAIDKYTRSVRPDAPWCPSNIEFIRRINGLKSVQDVYDIVFNASYLVLGLGDVYLGAPVATPVDPRQRLVTTKYNPARTWTAENSVGIGGAYMCVYGMEGPGGYQFVGRTIQMWNTYRTTREFPPNHPWLLQFFDRIRFFPVTAEELLRLREDFPNGRYPLRIEEGSFGLKPYREFLSSIEDSAAAFKATQQTAFQEERARWAASGADKVSDDDLAVVDEAPAIVVPPGYKALKASTAGSIWSIDAQEGDLLQPGHKVILIEAMKMEVAVATASGGTLHSLHCKPGMPVMPGQILAILKLEINA